MANLTPEQKAQLLEDRLYWRMYEVHLCKIISGLVDHHGFAVSTNIAIANLETHQFDSFKEIAYPIIDIGIVMCRALMQFLGIYYSDAGGGSLIAGQAKMHTDVTLFDFRNKYVQLDDLHRGPHRLTRQQKNALCRTLEAGNKGIAHLTSRPARRLQLPVLAQGCETVLQLMNQHLYVPVTGHPVTFSTPVKISLIPNRPAPST